MTKRRGVEGISAIEMIDAVLAAGHVFDLAEAIPAPDPLTGGRPRAYPDWAYVFYEVLVSVFGSARRVESELAHPLVWGHIRTTVQHLHKKNPEVWLPEAPMRRHHYRYARNTWLQTPDVLDALAERHRQLAAGTARRLGLLDPEGPGSVTHPHLSRMIYADGKVITPLYRVRPDDTPVDPATGEVLSHRFEPDAGLHWEGTGDAVWGTKFVLVAARTPRRRHRVILDIEPVTSPGHEAASAMACFDRLAPVLPGVQGVIYDTALRGVHHQHLLRDLGWVPVNKVTAKKATTSHKARRRSSEQREEKTVWIEDKTIPDTDGTSRRVSVYARGGAAGTVRRSDLGVPYFYAFERIKTHRRPNADGTWRWYNTYRLPDWAGAGTITLRLHTDESDEARGLNRTENLRVIPPADPDFKKLYARRNDAESINRHLQDTMWLGRAHSLGRHRQHLNLLGYATLVNAVALHEHRRRRHQATAA